MTLLLALSAWLAPGIGWTLPALGDTSGYHRLRQDTELSLLVQIEGDRWLAQLEVAGEGLTAGEPSFTLLSARVGAFLYRGGADVSISGGLGYAAAYTAKSEAECFNFGCDPFNGSGAAAVAGLQVRFPSASDVRGAVFLDLVLPLFDVYQIEYYAPTQAGGVGVVALGLRLFL